MGFGELIEVSLHLHLHISELRLQKHHEGEHLDEAKFRCVEQAMCLTRQM